eukprot:TRINITY_DN4631_c0_g1_i1.p1 TRINITY_DN4631_c0_g1~~TRINITY_DN4631_c0_g1_i1.p1  ORF type:complete len:453 (-),score=123.87 TRINITY_DN4631_c0_g1_i1:115-1473(-)
MVQPQRVRTRVSCGRVQGTVLSWGGADGFIAPSVRIEHPLASSNGGKIRVKKSDVSAGQKLAPGAKVDFLVFADGNSLGAEFCRLVPAASAGASASAASAAQVKTLKVKPTIEKKKAADVGKGRAATLQASPKAFGKGSNAKTNASSATSAPKPFAAASRSSTAAPATKTATQGIKGSKPKGKGAGQVQAPAAGKAGGGLKTAENALPRTSVSHVRHTGEVTKWIVGKFGWIKPAQPINHPAASKHNGLVYFKAGDVGGGSVIEVGSHVDFLVYLDATGLGAESCRVAHNAGGSAASNGPVKTLSSAFAAVAQNSGKGSSKGAGKSSSIVASKIGVQPTISKILTPKPKASATSALEKGGQQQHKKGLLQQQQQKGQQHQQKGQQQQQKGQPKVQSGKGAGGKVAQSDSKGKSGKGRGPLPPGWEQHWSDEYDVPYYWNSTTKESSWLRPTE